MYSTDDRPDVKGIETYLSRDVGLHRLPTDDRPDVKGIETGQRLTILFSDSIAKAWMQPMKYYLYISEAKVEMLLAQIPHDRKKKVASELGIDVKLMKASRKTETEHEESRVSRMESVVSFIRKNIEIGSIDEPAEYVHDIQSIGVLADPDGVYFCGATTKTTFALVGRSQPVEGATSLDWMTTYFLKGRLLFEMMKGTNYNLDGPSYAAKAMTHFVKDQALASRQLEVFAKRLFFDPSHRKHPNGRIEQLFIGTPLYVAMID